MACACGNPGCGNVASREAAQVLKAIDAAFAQSDDGAIRVSPEAAKALAAFFGTPTIEGLAVEARPVLTDRSLQGLKVTFEAEDEKYCVIDAAQMPVPHEPFKVVNRTKSNPS